MSEHAPEVVVVVGEAIGGTVGDCAVRAGQAQMGVGWETYRNWAIKILDELEKAGFQVVPR